MDPKTVDNAFNIFFLKAFENSNLNQEEKEYALSLLKDAFREIFPSVSIIPNTEIEIEI
jgi:hypothetical protein